MVPESDASAHIDRALTRLPVSGWLGLRLDAFYVSVDINLTSKLIAAYRICARMLPGPGVVRELQRPRTSHNNNIHFMIVICVGIGNEASEWYESAVSQCKGKVGYLLAGGVVAAGCCDWRPSHRQSECAIEFNWMLRHQKRRRSTYINGRIHSHPKCAAAGETAENPSKSNSNGNNIRDFNDFPSDASHSTTIDFTSCILKLSSAAYYNQWQCNTTPAGGCISNGKCRSAAVKP